MFEELFSNPVIIIALIVLIIVIIVGIFKFIKGLILNTANSISMSPFLKAVSKGNTEEFLSLLELDNNIDKKNTFGDNALILAVINGHIDILNILLNKGLDINFKGSHGQTALIKSIIKNKRDITNILIDNGANLNPYDSDGFSALVYAVVNNDIDLVNKLIDSNSKVTSGALLTSINFNFTEIAVLLIKHGADVNAIGSFGDSMIMKAIRKKNIEIVKLLLEKNVDLTVRNENQITAFHLANKEITKLLHAVKSK